MHKRTRHLPIIAVMASCLAFLASCSKDEALAPDFTISVTPGNVAVGEAVTIRIDGSAETFSVFTGDAGSDYSKSHASINEGKDIDAEDYWLPADRVDAVMELVNTPIDWHNEKALTDQGLPVVNKDAVRAAVVAMADIHFDNAELIRTRFMSIVLALSDAKQLSQQFMAFCQNNNAVHTPEGGYAKGHAVDRYLRTLVYSYSAPGTYTITVVGTNTGRKLYNGDGYKTNMVTQANEYGYARLIRTFTITVSN